MRLVTFRKISGEESFGILTQSGVLPMPLILREARLSISLPQNLLEFIGQISLWQPIVENFLEQSTALARKWEIPLNEITLCAPIPRPRREVICLGLNYRDHIEQNARATGAPAVIPEIPMFFGKPTTSVIGPDVPIEWDPEITQKLDYEAEFSLVIGRRGKNIPAEKAWDHLLGYTLVNDVSARDVQLRVSQFYQGKGMDTYCPMGPSIVTKDEIESPEQVELTLRVNGVTRQKTTIASMIFDIPHIIAAASRGMTLEPGDIITTATPGGCAYAQPSPEFLKDGDVVECEATGIGVLRNPVVKVQGRYSL